jgi:hypothetical protein
MEERSEGLLAWQWGLYAQGHRDRRNLLLHIVAVPIFLAGTLAMPASLLAGAWPGAVGGLVAMIVAAALQGRGHKLEAVGPVPPRGPLDLPIRLFVEQWVTFPRFVLSGGWARAWRQAKR